MFYRAVMLAMLLIVLPGLPTNLSASGIPVEGRVLDPAGKPLAKAEVLLESIPSGYERARLRMAGAPGPPPVERTRTDNSGAFVLTAPKAGMWKVVVASPGLLTMEFRLIPLLEDVTLQTVELTPAADLAVRLVDTKGKPRPGSVGAFTLGNANDGWRPQLRIAAAGEDGIAHLPLGQDEKIQLEILAAGHPLAVYELFDETSLTIELPVGVQRTVRVIGGEEQALENALVFQGTALLPLGLTDSTGRLPVVLQAESAPALRISTADLWHGSFEFDPDTPNDQVMELQLKPPTTLKGRVLDLSNREPVANALTWVVRGRVAVTDAQGRFDLKTGIFRSGFVQAAAAGYQKGHLSMNARGGSTRIKTDGLTVPLMPAASLSGKVLDRDGGQLEGVDIALRILPRTNPLQRVPRSMLSGGLRGRTSRDGIFQFRGLPSSVAFELTFETEGFAPRTLKVEPLKMTEDRSDLVVVLELGRVAIGKIVDGDEAPIAGAEVRLKYSPPTNDLMASNRQMQEAEGAESKMLYLTDAEGRFEIIELADGRYDLEVRATGFATTSVPGVRIPKDSRQTDLGTVALVKGSSIAGVVKDSAGGFVVDAEVTVALGHQGFSVGQPANIGEVSQTDLAGKFELVDLPPGKSFDVSVDKQGYSSEVVGSVRPPIDKPLTIVLRSSGHLEGTVTDPRGEPISGAFLWVYPDFQANPMTVPRHDRTSRGRSDDKGHFQIEDVDLGAMQLNISAQGYLNLNRQKVEIVPGAVTEVEFILQRGAVVEGHVTATDGTPIVEAEVSISEQRDGRLMGNEIISATSSMTDIDGRYQIAGAPIGVATVSVKYQHSQRLSQNLDIRPGTNLQDLVIERGFEISGQVVDSNRNPMHGARLLIHQFEASGMGHSSFGSSEQISDADGRFVLTDIRAGKYAVSGRQDGFALAHSEPFDLSADLSGLILELHRGASLKGRVLGLDLDELSSLKLLAFNQLSGAMQAQVDFSGEYMFENLSPGQWFIQAKVEGTGRSSTLQVEIPEGAVEVEQDIEFGSGLTLTGFVFDGDQPLVGAIITARGSKGGIVQGITDADGRFRFEDLEAGNQVVMVISDQGLQHTESLDLVADHELRIELAGGSVSGTVTNASSGEPLTGAVISFESLTSSTGSLLSGAFGRGDGVETDSEGLFQIPRVRQGQWRIKAAKPGHAPGEATVDVKSDSTSVVAIQLVPTEGVTFEIALPSGNSVLSVQVALLDPSSRRLDTGTFAVNNGQVRVSMVPPGQWDLVIQAPGSAATRVTVTSPGDQGRLVLPTGGTLHVKVPELEQVALASLVLQGPDGRPFVAPKGVLSVPGEQIMQTGQSVIQGLVPGDWSVTVRAPDGRTWSGNATVSPGVTTEVSLP